jgi:hypothetical protein
MNASPQFRHLRFSARPMSRLSPGHRTGYYTTFEEDRRTNHTAKKNPDRIFPTEENQEEDPVSRRHV